VFINLRDIFNRCPRAPETRRVMSPGRLAVSLCGEWARGDRWEVDGGELESVRMRGDEPPSTEKR
jgi:hypothetical protein